MKANRKALIISLAIPLAVGGLAALLTMGGMADYAKLQKPPLSPPAWLFPVAWTALYLLMGYSSYLVYAAGDPRGKRALILYAAQLLVNFIWPILFFGLRLRLTAFFWLALLWVLVYLTMRRFSDISERAGDLLLPYILWLTFAGYLNLGAFLLN